MFKKQNVVDHFGSESQCSYLLQLVLMAASSGGGARQLAAAIAHEQGSGQPSEFIDRLLKLFGWGLLSASTCQWLAEGARLDGLEIGPVKKMAGVGTSGTYSGNFRRDLLRSFCGSMALAKPVNVEVPLMSKLQVMQPHPKCPCCPRH